MSVNPKQPRFRSGAYRDETAIFTDLNNVLRQFATKKLRYSRTSPPILADVPEGEFILDKTLNRIYITVNGSLKYFSLT